MTINEAKTYLIASAKPEYRKYIETELAGDFAVAMAIKMSEMQEALTECNKVEKDG